MRVVVPDIGVGHVEDAREEGREEVQRGPPNEAEEVAVVPLADAGPGPGAMVVEHLHAAVAVDAVLPSRRAIDVAGLAVLGAVQRVDGFVFRGTPRYYSRLGEINGP